MTSEQVTAFRNAVGGASGGPGYSPDSFAVLFALIVAGALLTWGAYIVMSLGEDFLSGRLKLEKMFAYKVRVLVLVLLMVYLLH
jgi:hypothetical protein